MIGKLLSERYQLTESLGKGGMATVYKALDQRLQRFVAIKIMNAGIADAPHIATQFATEAQNAASLNHPNVVAVYDFGEDDGSEYIVLELVSGRTLREILNEGPLPVERAISYARQLAAGLAAAHSRRILHCDIKPQNILISESDEVKLADFGISRILAGTSMLTRGTILGTLDYLAPEQIEGSKPDERSDIYALGLVIYEMLSGTLPFERGQTTAQALAQKLANDPKPLSAVAPQVSPDVEAAVMRALAKEPAARYESVELMADALAPRGKVEQHQPSTVGPFDAPTVAVAAPPRKPTDASAARKPGVRIWTPSLTLLTLIAVGALVFVTALAMTGPPAATEEQPSGIADGGGGDADSDNDEGGIQGLGNVILAALTSSAATSTATATPTSTSTPTATSTPPPTATSTPTPTATATQTPLPTPTATARVRNGTLNVRRRSGESLSLTDLDPGSTLEVSFTVEGGNDDIAFRVTGPDGKNLIDLDRVQGRYEFRLEIKQPGKYTLIFDNRFSLITNKVVNYRLTAR